MLTNFILSYLCFTIWVGLNDSNLFYLLKVKLQKLPKNKEN